ncbi:hypothetical protein [Bradyrhizobium sp. USDA 4508]
MDAWIEGVVTGDGNMSADANNGYLFVKSPVGDVFCSSTAFKFAKGVAPHRPAQGTRVKMQLFAEQRKPGKYAARVVQLVKP